MVFLLYEMKYQVLLAFTLLNLASHYTEVVAPQPPPTKNCTELGFFCESCTSLVTCIRLGGDEFTKTNQETCPKGTTCQAKECISELYPPCQYQGLNFPCSYQGMYPDPADWSKFFYCVPGSTEGSFTAYHVNCGTGSGYNALTGYCDKILEDIKETDYPVPICEKSHSMLTLEANPSIYYECREYSTSVPILYPFQSTCPRGGIFDKFECKPAIPTTTPSPETTSTLTTEPPPETTSTPTTEPPPKTTSAPTTKPPPKTTSTPTTEPPSDTPETD